MNAPIVYVPYLSSEWVVRVDGPSVVSVCLAGAWYPLTDLRESMAAELQQAYDAMPLNATGEPA